MMEAPFSIPIAVPRRENGRLERFGSFENVIRSAKERRDPRDSRRLRRQYWAEILPDVGNDEARRLSPFDARRAFRNYLETPGANYI